MVSIEILRNITLFQGLHIEQLDLIGKSLELQRLEKGCFLFREGERADTLFVLVSGRLEVSRRDARGLRFRLAQVEPGACLGEMGISTGAPRSADVLAIEESILLRISRLQFERLIRSEPTFATRLIADLSQKLLDANKWLETRSKMPVKERLWRALCELAEGGRLSPPPKVTHLAARIDASREMTSRALGELVLEKKLNRESEGEWMLFSEEEGT